MSNAHFDHEISYLPKSLQMMIVAALVAIASVPAHGSEQQTPINIGSRLELLLDDYLFESINNLSFKLHSPQPAEKVLSFDAPWEGPSCDYVTVFKDGDRYRMYYASHIHGFGADVQYTCYAESRDGIHWAKPSLGLFEFNGSKHNNIVWSGGKTSHNFAPFIDTRQGVPSNERYKAVGGCPKPYVFASADGIHWRKMSDEPLTVKGAFDSQNVAFWDAEQRRYVFYFRVFEQGRRHIARSTSPDCLTWSDGVSIDVGATPREQLYTNATIPYFRAPHLYLAFPMRYVTTRQPLAKAPRQGVCDGVFMFSRDGRHFSRRYMEAFLRPGSDPRNWNKHSIMIAWGLLPTAEDEISIYYSQHYWFKDAHLRRGVLRTDGFVSLNAPYSAGECTTKPLIFSGDQLVLNAATSAPGGVRVEIQDADGKPLEGYRLKECVEFYGDKIAHTVHWKGGSDLSVLAGKPVRLRFKMRAADLYSFRFTQ